MTVQPVRWGILGAADIARKNWQAILISGRGVSVAVASRTRGGARGSGDDSGICARTDDGVPSTTSAARTMRARGVFRERLAGLGPQGRRVGICVLVGGDARVL